MNTNIHLWLHGLLAAVLSALGDSGTVALGAAVVAPGFLRDSRFWEALAGMLVFSALKTVFAYLKQSPLPCGNASATAPALGHAAQ
jgi:hypothetical protein